VLPGIHEPSGRARTEILDDVRGLDYRGAVLALRERPDQDESVEVR
jgi:hypothetical protein